VLLTCPMCRSGLEVPDGTTAKVRCAACKTVFSAAESAPPVEEAEDEPAPPPKARKRREEPEEEERPKKRKPKKTEAKSEKDENRDFDPVTEEDNRRTRKARKAARARNDKDLPPEEKAARRAAFDRAAWGARLIFISFALFMVSMLFIIAFFFQTGLSKTIRPQPVFITLAGICGACGWVLSAIGTGLCLSGPPVPGHYGFGWAALSAVVLHLVFLVAIVASNSEYSVGREIDRATGENQFGRWSMLATRLDATMFYMTAVAYPHDQGATPRDPMALSMFTGLLEMVRTVLVMMLLSSLARSALDNELAHKCTRAAGIASGGPVLVAALMLAFVAAVIETGAGLNMFTRILFAVVNMSVYAILMGVSLPALLAAREVTDACDEPYQSLIPQL
jgi:LSD1 subclass zinc finger protein